MCSSLMSIKIIVTNQILRQLMLHGHTATHANAELPTQELSETKPPPH